MKVIFFTKYTRKGASSRLRTFQYLKFLEQNGIRCIVSPFFDDVYLAEVYKYKRHNKFLALKSFFKRVAALFTLNRYDKVVIEKELFPYFPALFEWIIHRWGIKYIVDYDDAIFHNYDVSPNRLIRFFLGDKIRKVVRYADTVVVGNAYLKEKVLAFGAKKVVLIPTVIDVQKYAVGRGFEGPFVIGWIGSPITFKYLSNLKKVFLSLSAKYTFKIRYIGSNTTLGLPNEEIVPWSENDEVNQIRQFSVGIMPLEDNIWERGKCGYKLIQYMGCGVPVVGTPIGVNDELIRNNYNGFKARTITDWEMALETLITNTPDKNRLLGLNGRAMVEEGYSLQVYQSVWLSLLREK